MCKELEKLIKKLEEQNIKVVNISKLKNDLDNICKLPYPLFWDIIVNGAELPNEGLDIDEVRLFCEAIHYKVPVFVEEHLFDVDDVVSCEIFFNDYPNLFKSYKKYEDYKKAAEKAKKEILDPVKDEIIISHITASVFVDGKQYIYFSDVENPYIDKFNRTVHADWLVGSIET